MGLFSKKTKNKYEGFNLRDELRDRAKCYLDRQINCTVNFLRTEADKGNFQLAIGGVDCDIIDAIIDYLRNEGLEVEKYTTSGFTVTWR